MIGGPIGRPIGAGQRQAEGTGILVSGASTIVGSGTSTSAGTGLLISGAATIVSAGIVTDLPVTSGLVGHFDAAEITGLSDGDPVSAWNDGSVEGNNAAQATASLQPIYKTGILNGQPVVRFDGVDDRLVVPDDDSLDHASLSVFVVWVLRGNSTGTDFARIVSKGQSTTANGAWGIQCKDVTDPDDLGLRFISGFTAHDIRNSALSSGYDDGAGHISTFVHNETNGNGLFRLDQVEEATLDLADGVGIRTTADDLQIGNGNSERPFNGDIGEVIIYNRALSTAEIAQVESYLFDKWIGAAAIEGTGLLVSGASVLAGLGNIGWTGTGLLTSGAADIDGAGSIFWDATGLLVSGAASIEAEGVSGSTGTGLLVSDAATIIGVGQNLAEGTGLLISGPASIFGLSEITTFGTGLLVSGDATIIGFPAFRERDPNTTTTYVDRVGDSMVYTDKAPATSEIYVDKSAVVSDPYTDRTAAPSSSYIDKAA